MQWFQVLKTGPWIGPVFTTRAAKKKPGNFLISKPTIVFFAANTPCPAKHRSPEGAHAGAHRKTIEEKATAPLFETILGFNSKPRHGPCNLQVFVNLCLYFWAVLLYSWALVLSSWAVLFSFWTVLLCSWAVLLHSWAVLLYS